MRWHFWLVSDEYDDFVHSEIESGPDRERRLVNRGPNYSVGVKTWGEILDENNARLQFVKQALEHNADDGQALAFLEERHREFLEGVIIQESSAESTEPLRAGVNSAD